MDFRSEFENRTESPLGADAADKREDWRLCDSVNALLRTNWFDNLNAELSSFEADDIRSLLDTTFDATAPQLNT
jgi:hypothetical protein